MARERTGRAMMPLARTIAIVGSDGAGKSTLAADMVAALGGRRPAAFVYLGQSSGNILARLRALPLAGPALGRFLVRRSERTHAEARQARAPDIQAALVIHLLSRWRLHKFRRLAALDRRGTTVIADRWPQAEVPGFWFDGPGLAALPGAGRAVRRIAAREAALYRRMAATPPALVIRLNIDAATAHARKPDHRLAMLEEKARVIPTLGFAGAAVRDLDATAPYERVLADALAAARRALPAD